MTNRLINYTAFAIFSLLWLGFLAGLLFSPAALDAVWQSFRSWPWILQLAVGLLVLPVAAGLWIWETGWAFWLRLILVLGLAWVTVYTFFPRKEREKPQPSPAKP
jgi:hypothetical protein